MLDNESPSIFSIRKRNNIEYPEVIYLDTSFLVHAMCYDVNNYYVSDHRSFMKSAIENEVHITFSHNVISEFKHSLIKAVGKDEIKNNNIYNEDDDKVKEVFQKDKNLRKKVEKEYIKNEYYFNKSGFIRLEYTTDEDFTLLENSLGFYYGLDSYDARHVALMLKCGVNSIATMDDDFMNVPFLNIYGATKSINDYSNNNESIISYEEDIVDNLIEKYKEDFY